MTAKTDYRTREGREQEALAEIAINGAISVQWAAEVPQRAAAVNRLQAAGRIRPLPGGHDDFLRFEIVERRQPRRSVFQWLDALFARFA